MYIYSVTEQIHMVKFLRTENAPRNKGKANSTTNKHQTHAVPHPSSAYQHFFFGCSQDCSPTHSCDSSVVNTYWCRCKKEVQRCVWSLNLLTTFCFSLWPLNWTHICFHRTCSPTDLSRSVLPILRSPLSLTLCPLSFPHNDVNKVNRMDYPDSHGRIPALCSVSCSALFTGGNHSLSLITLHHAIWEHTHTHRPCQHTDTD